MLVCIIDCIYTFGYLIICSLRLFIFHINQNNANAICKILKTNEYETNPRQYPAKCTTNQPNQQTPKPTPIFYTPSQQIQQQQRHNITLGCVGSRCRWFINRPPPTHHTNLDAIYRWRTTRTRMSKRSCWARRACAPVSRAKI